MTSKQKWKRAHHCRNINCSNQVHFRVSNWLLRFKYIRLWIQSRYFGTIVQKLNVHSWPVFSEKQESLFSNQVKQVHVTLIAINLWLCYCFKHVKGGIFSSLGVDSFLLLLLSATNSPLCQCKLNQTSQGASKNATPHVNCTLCFCLIFKNLQGKRTISDSTEGLRGTIYGTALEVQFENKTFASLLQAKFTSRQNKM